MIVRRLDDIKGTDRDVDTPTWNSRRLLLAGDGMGFSLHDTILRAGTTTKMQYLHHLEAVYCIEGTGWLVDLSTGARHRIEPDTVYALDAHDEHELVIDEGRDMRFVCVFNPPVTGMEVHGEDGAYPPPPQEKAS